MTTRRQASTTSLSKYARASSPGVQNHSLDFCNAFWGHGDGGVDVLFARMRGAARTMEELKNFWKERRVPQLAAIEEDYAKRLARLAKTTLGRDEIGELRHSLDTLRTETDKQAGCHLNLAQQIRTELEVPVGLFHQKQLQHKKGYQAAVEKEFKTKQAQEVQVGKAKEKYEADCVRINSYTAQSSLVQGKDLDKITLKLERAQQTVLGNQRDFATLTKILQDTVGKWEQEWKTFCDSCQDMEEKRMEVMKDHMWAYANAVSTVCVSDDESCERVRVSLEQMEPERDMENFVRDYGTGNEMPDPPAFVNYNTPDAIPSSSSRPTSRPAQFVRSSHRELPTRQNSVQPEEEPTTNAAGVGAGGRREPPAEAPLARQPTQIQKVPYGGPAAAQANGNSSVYNNKGPSPANGVSPPPTQALNRRPTNAGHVPRQSGQYAPDPHAETIDPTAETYIKVGNNAYKVDLSRDPQQQGGPSNRAAAASPTKPGPTTDPLARQLEELKNVVSATGSVRRGVSPNPNPKPSVAPDPRAAQASIKRQSLSPPANGGAAQPPARDYRNSAEVVVGAHPSVSRPPSPNPPTAAFMVPKPSIPPPSSEIIEGVLTDYHQSLPGERKSISRSNSHRASYSGQLTQSPASMGPTHTPNASQGQGQTLARPPSQVGHPGIGAHGSRSNSPQPVSRGPSPAPPNARNNYIAPPPAQGITRAVSPNTVGIALDPNGRVLHDEMAQGYRQPPQHQQMQQQQPQRQPTVSRQPPPPTTQQQQQYNPPPQNNPQRRPSYMGPPPINNPGMMPPPHQPPGIPAPTATAELHPAAPAQPVYNPPPVQYQPPPPQQPVYQPQPHASGYGVVGGLQQGAPGYGQYAPKGINPASLYQPQAPGYQNAGYRGPSPAGRSPSPQPPPMQQQQYQPQQGAPPPTGQTTEGGAGILFYVKALYDYVATIDEEFDFQAGDIIAVTATPEDGWWSGELLDEERRQKGRHVFPSNFVCLF
ncbi:hypothetical protein BD779DRAFT_1646363 [Infundibulicybe gibba]|nr:hypothetical protein BD779DRAFT_1646363 [Infundibulicybe gibba]